MVVGSKKRINRDPLALTNAADASASVAAAAGTAAAAVTIVDMPGHLAQINGPREGERSLGPRGNW